MKIGVLIPDRGDRPELLQNCLRMIKAQTLQPEIIELVDDAPLNDSCDITWRYRTGYDRLRNKGLDLIAFFENDDWYHPQYLETMVNAWVNEGKPQLIGTNYTIYYHIKLKAYYPMYHSIRASAMNTLIIPDMNFEWCIDTEPYTDIHLWKKLKGIVIKPKQHISIGIKHGIGKCGGHMHVDRLHRYRFNATDDQGSIFLKRTMDPDSYKFYTNVFQ